MPLLEMSLNIQETEATGRKRSHDEFEVDTVKAEGSEGAKLPLSASDQPNGDCALPFIVTAGSQSTPQASPDLTEAGSSTPARKSPSPQTPAKKEAAKSSTTTGSASKSAANPSVKRKKLSAAEKEAREKEVAKQKEEREEKAAIRAVEKAKADAEKAARVKEREDKRRQKEEEKKRKDEEKKRKEDEEEKKTRQQRTLGSFFKVPNTPKKADDSTTSKASTPGDSSPVKLPNRASKSEYEKLFKPFFIKEHTRVACLGPPMDTETRDAKSKILDECIGGERADELQASPFDPVHLLALPGKPSKRGRLHHPVRHIMEHVYKETEKSDNASPDHAAKIMQEAREKLSKVPMKVIAFSRDVRPPYYGTMSFKPFALGKSNMSQLARKPMGRRLPLDYEYDSEAEWQEEEEGEDLEADDDEEEVEDEDDMDGFLDDSEDAGLSRRVFANALQPESTGICFEDTGLVMNHVVYEHRMEIMHTGLEQTWGIDPFSTQYWEPEIKARTTRAAPAVETGARMAPPPTRVNAFVALTSGTGAGGNPKLVKAELMDDVKQAILANKSLSKAGIIDYVFHKFQDDVSRTEVKNTLELVAEKTGKGRTKEWTLRSGHEITA
ncbi:hypothetical protein FZEAL_3111 [Fusarium zealandicum]|uniref:Chromatin assembly factor 1 subunit rlf2 n=1 Tax=Fusarium zealandicum TaxID=1053134 RepID=A0A8H4UQ83_9HYPO|nr:hypothetical protein FZEAL_3111 [Fusarium zealandicum]